MMFWTHAAIWMLYSVITVKISVTTMAVTVFQVGSAVAGTSIAK